MINVCEPTLIGNEKKYVNECLDTNWISSNGRFINKFENDFADFCETKHAVSCSSGTAALHLALDSIGIKKGDEVIVPTFTMIATTNAIMYCGGTPVYVDSNMKDWNMDVKQIEKVITKQTKAIIAVHTYGCPCDMDKINKIAKKYNLVVIEDAAEAHGALYKGHKVGSLGDIACFSFYGNKILTTGEGGMITTNNSETAILCKYLKNHAFGVPRFIHSAIGYNYRMTNIQAAIGCAQVENADILVYNRKANATLYNKYLKGVKGITLPPKCKNGTNVYWMYGILVNKMDRDLFMQELRQNGIDTRTFFFPCHKQPCYPKINKEFPVADKLWRTGLYLPSGGSLTVDQIKEVCDVIKNVLK